MAMVCPAGGPLGDEVKLQSNIFAPFQRREVTQFGQRCFSDERWESEAQSEERQYQQKSVQQGRGE